MANEIIEATKALSPIIVAIIGGVAGLITGTIASLIAPWVQYAIEKKRKSIEYKTNLIKETRVLLDKHDDFKNIKASSLWGFISDNLNEKEKRKVFPEGIVIELSATRLDSQMSQDDLKKQGISSMLSRLEKKWELTKT